ncbi:MAG: CHASE4 domain-containing protein [Candidatus Thermoplasmatota archaeon]|nr:CHASE4 domain-containing protein [Candidatus Thermoplasmatota archaeon]
MSDYEKIEKHNVINNVKLFENTLNNEIKKLDYTVGDWAPWDDSYYFIKGEFDEYPSQNLNIETMKNLHVDVIMFIDLTGQNFFEKAYDFDNWEEENLSSTQTGIILEKFSIRNNIVNISDSINGLILLPENPLIMAIRPISNSTFKAPIAGYLFMGRYLDSNELNYLSSLANLSVFISNFNNPNTLSDDNEAIEFLSEKNDIFIHALNNDIIAGYTKINDITNEPILLVKVIMDRDIYKQAVITFTYFRLSIISIGIILGMVLIIFSDRTLLYRLNNLSNQVLSIGKKNNPLTRVKISGNDELNDLADVMNKTLDELEKLNLTLEQKVKERTKEIEILLKQKDEFIDQLSHDLKNPITPIVNLLPSVINKTEDPETKEILEVINRNAYYMKNLVNNTLKLSRLNKSTVEFDIKEFNLFKIVDNIIKDNSSMLNKKSMNVENFIEPTIFIKADELQFKEVINNLISNAVKYSNHGGTITFDAKKSDDNKFVTISVKDNGIGLSDEQKDYIFNEFYKADDSRHDFGSTGLGLSICKKIVERHGGRIWVESKGLNMGTTIFFTMPLASQQ